MTVWRRSEATFCNIKLCSVLLCSVRAPCGAAVTQRWRSPAAWQTACAHRKITSPSQSTPSRATGNKSSTKLTASDTEWGSQRTGSSVTHLGTERATLWLRPSDSALQDSVAPLNKALGLRFLIPKFYGVMLLLIASE